MNEILIADGKGRLGLRGPYFHLFWAPESQVDADDALASIEAMRGLGGTARPLLLEISGVTLSNAARAAFAHAQPASAVAMLGSSVVDTVMGAALSRHDHCPHAYFTSEAEALAWLDSLAAQPACDAR
ncbi:STAS/SEC14 domain-containing protein [Arthrobacter sp. KBS0702]|uniref:DUF7793 family protein n=1 Tax=Arthrobacter sp. KBS0702 TaxID=2578107 RepID=UPI00110D30D2|nr:STAS/SEC14 domain-containing protein [Arthrobacter sp. KBS0702]QDW29945.1 STAS/SEC14 domain-containing protein [Arthrobacter sp. KBS0702]